MNTISSKHENAQDILDAALVLVSLTLVFLLLAAGPHAGEALSSISQAITAWSSNSGDASLSVGGTAVFVADQRYWDANCSHGWTANSTCADIAQRAQSCRISLASAYCSSYDSYLGHFRK